MKTKGRRILLSLALVYLAASALRFALALATCAYPVTIPDEFLYYSIARSLAAGEGALFLGQQANYSYCFYPLLLSLVYRLPAGTNYYRLLQLVSILIMNLSLFPLYALGKELLGDERKSLRLAACFLALPDFLLGQAVLSESLLYPLFFLTLWLAYSGEIKKLAAAGFVGGLLFAVKPGQIVTPLVLIVAAAAEEWRRSPSRALAKLGAGLGAAALSAGGMLLLNLRALNPGTGLLAVYERQVVVGEASDPAAFLRGAALSPYAFLLAAGVLPVLAPLCYARRFERRQRMLLDEALVSVAALMLGTAWVVNRVEAPDPTVHTRYVGCWIPVFLLLLAALPESEAGKKGSRLASPPPRRVFCALLLAACVLPELIFRYDGSVNLNANPISYFPLSWLHALASAAPGSVMLTILFAGALIGLYFVCVRLKPARLKRAGAAVLVFFALLGNVCACVLRAGNTDTRAAVKADSETIRAAIGGERYVDVIGDSKTRYDALLDVNEPASVSVIYVNDLFNHTAQSGGVYEPFVPAEIRGDLPDRLTADAELMVFDRDALSHAELSPYATVEAETELMTLVRVTPGERWADSMLGGPVGTRLPAGTTAYFVRFDDGSPETLRIDMTLAADARVVVGIGNDGGTAFELPAGRDEYELSVNGARTVTFTADCDVRFSSYSFLN